MHINLRCRDRVVGSLVKYIMAYSPWLDHPIAVCLLVDSAFFGWFLESINALNWPAQRIMILPLLFPLHCSSHKELRTGLVCRNRVIEISENGQCSPVSLEMVLRCLSVVDYPGTWLVFIYRQPITPKSIL